MWKFLSDSVRRSRELLEHVPAKGFIDKSLEGLPIGLEQFRNLYTQACTGMHKPAQTRAWAWQPYIDRLCDS